MVEIGTVCLCWKVSSTYIQYIPKLAEKDEFDLIRIHILVCTLYSMCFFWPFIKVEVLHATPLFCRFSFWYLQMRFPLTDSALFGTIATFYTNICLSSFLKHQSQFLKEGSLKYLISSFLELHTGVCMYLYSFYFYDFIKNIQMLFLTYYTLHDGQVPDSCHSNTR